MRAIKCFASYALAFSALTVGISGWAKLPGRARPDQRPSNPSSRQADLTWWGGGNRFFVGTRTDFGYLFLRPRLSAGYGRPHHTWVGADLNPTLSRHAAGGYFGGRLAHPHIRTSTSGRGLATATPTRVDSCNSATPTTIWTCRLLTVLARATSRGRAS